MCAFSRAGHLRDSHLPQTRVYSPSFTSEIPPNDTLSTSAGTHSETCPSWRWIGACLHGHDLAAVRTHPRRHLLPVAAEQASSEEAVIGKL